MEQIKCPKCETQIQADNITDMLANLQKHLTTHEGKPPLFPEPEPPGEWEERSAQFTIFDEEGQEMVGMLMGFDTIKIHDKEIRRARIKTAHGTNSFLLTTQLEPLLLDLPENTTVRIRYEGEVKSAAGHRVKRFRVWTLKGAP